MNPFVGSINKDAFAAIYNSSARRWSFGVGVAGIQACSEERISNSNIVYHE